MEQNTSTVAADCATAEAGTEPQIADVLYKLDSSRVTIREYWWGTHSPLILLALIIKLLRVRIPGSTDDPNVESLDLFEVGESSVPEDLKARFAPMLRELANLGFSCPIFHLIRDPLHLTQTCTVSMGHISGRAVARIHSRIWSYRHPPRDYLFCEFLTPFSDGSYLWSLSSKPDMLAPPVCRINRKVKARVGELWASHQALLSGELARRTIAPVHGEEQVREAVERHHDVVREFHVRRGVFAPLDEADRKRIAALEEKRKAIEAGGLQHPEVMAELDRLQNKQSGWLNGLVLLVVSLMIFMGAGASQSDPTGMRTWPWDTLFILVGVLCVHELGHYVAMRAFHYRNLRMFFIPFLGAAVTGRNYNVPGWKKAIVSLMGPAPGILLGCILGVIGLIAHQELLLKISVMSLILNGLNLLPVLPLDGGWIMHTVLFSRHFVLDAASRCLAGIALIVVGTKTQDRWLMFLGIFLLLGLPLAYNLARITAGLHKSGLTPASPDDQTIPVATAQVIIGKIKEAFPRGMSNKMIATNTLHVFETLNARPPGWLASIGLLTVHGTALVAAMIFSILFIIGQRGDVMDFMRMAASAPRNKLSIDSIATWKGAEAQSSASRNTIVATFSRPGRAQSEFERLKGRLPATAMMRLFGQSVLISLPQEDDSARKLWYQYLNTQAKDVFVGRGPGSIQLTLTCVAPTDAAAIAIEEEANEYFTASSMHPLPPWMAGDTRSAEQKSQHRLARRTYRRLTLAGVKAYGSPEMLALGKQENEAEREGDRAAVARLRKEQAKLMEDLRQREIDAIRAEARTTADPLVISNFLELPKQDPANHKLYAEQLMNRIGPRLGQLPLVNGEPDPRMNGASAKLGHTSRSGLLLTCWASFVDPFEGQQEFLAWLRSKGCVDFRYELFAGYHGDDPPVGAD